MGQAVTEPLVDAIATCLTGMLATGKALWNDADQRYEFAINADAVARSIAAMPEFQRLLAVEKAASALLAHAVNLEPTREHWDATRD